MRTNLTGQRFGMLVVLYDGGRILVCACDCGVGTMPLKTNVTGGHTTSCGCVRSKTEKVASLTHGATIGKRWSRLYRIWHGMIQRCLNPKSASYERYGARGITVSTEWRSFKAFAQDMKEPPSADHSLERKDNNGPYSKENCVWATERDQQRNRRDTIRLTYKGKTQSLAAWAEERGRNYYTMHSQLKRGWSPERVLEESNG